MILKIDPENPEAEKIAAAVSVIKRGGVVIFPTDTVYGIGVDAGNEEAVKRLYEIKGRPAGKPFAVLVSSLSQVKTLVKSVSRGAQKLIKQHWPGPLTLILPKRGEVSELITAGHPSIAVRMPAHPVALKLIEACGKPLVTSSANRSGNPAPADAQAANEELGDQVDLILDGGPSPHGIASTIVDATVSPPQLLREGSATLES